jgi:hypothetical protein
MSDPHGHVVTLRLADRRTVSGFLIEDGTQLARTGSLT